MTLKPSEPLESSPKVFTHFHAFAILLAIIAVFVGLYWIMPSKPIRPDPTMQEGVGSTLPFLELQPLTGDPSAVALKDLKGRVTLLNFWGTWCPPCRAELPHLVELRQRFAGQKAFQLLAVSCPSVGDDDAASLKEETAAFLKRMKLDLPTFHDPDQTTLDKISPVIAFDGFPTTLLLDRHGVIRAVWVGYWSGIEAEMERHVGMVLDEKR